MKLATLPPLNTLRLLLNELRMASKDGTLKDNLASKYILDQFRKYNTTDQQLCKAKEEVQYLGQTYLCYLNSSRKYTEIYLDYKGKGERSVRETADMVGFKLPQDPRVPRVPKAPK